MSRLFNQRVNLTGSRGTSPALRVSFFACVMDGSLDEPFATCDSTSSRRRYTVVAKLRDLGGSKPQIGDIVEFTDGSKYAIAAVEPFYDRELIMDVRSC